MVEGSMLVASCLFASFLIFVFGIYVGKEVQAQKTVEQVKPLRVPVGWTKAALLDRSPAPPLASPSSPQPAVPVQERAVPKRAAQRPKPASPPPPAVLAKAKPEAKPQPTPDKTPPERPAAGLLKKPPVKSRLWSVQVQATTQENAARQTARHLRRQGYSPSISKIVRQNRVWYRVRVGPFTKEVEAKATVSRFRRQKTFAQAYPVSH